MNVKLIVALLFALVAACHASYTIILSYSDLACSGDKLVAVYATNDPVACAAKRSVSEVSGIGCSQTKEGFSYLVDFSFCSNDTVPTFPAEWQVLLLSTDNSCNATSDQATISLLAAPQNFGPTWIGVYVLGSFTVSNTTFGCDTASGNISATACFSLMSQQTCIAFSNLEADVCSIDASSQFFGKQSTCVAPPVAVPEAAPVAAPVATPVATPTTTTTPVKAPTKASSASVFGVSAALLTFVALL